MIPVHVRVRHDPPNGLFGDCMRACVASIMEMQAEDVPHFAMDGCDGTTQLERVRRFLRPMGLTLCVFLFPGEESRSDVLAYMGQVNPNATYILCGALASPSEGVPGGDHAVVAQGKRIAHDPSWYPTGIVGPTSAGVWQLLVITKL